MELRWQPCRRSVQFVAIWIVIWGGLGLQSSAGFDGSNVRSLGVLDANEGFLCDVAAIGDEANYNVDLDLDVGDAADSSLASASGSSRGNAAPPVKTYTFEVCAPRWKDHIPCLDGRSANAKLDSGSRGEEAGERRCPRKGSMCCLIAAPVNYRPPIRWPKSRTEIRYSNVPHAQSLAGSNGGENWVELVEDNVVRFPGGDIRPSGRAHEYLDHIGQMAPAVGYGSRTRVALDVGCGVATFGAFLFDRDVITLSMAPKDGHEAQLAMERGVPALVAALGGTWRLGVPSQAFDLVHCSRCRVNWTRDGGLLLLEADRVLRGGAYFVWSPQHDDPDAHVWRDMEELAKQLCWEQVGRDELVAIWRKPRTSACLRSRAPGARPALCDAATDVDPDRTWYVPLQPCVAVLAEDVGDVPEWPTRLSTPPRRLQGVEGVDAGLAGRPQVFRADQRYWHVVVEGYLRGLGLRREAFRNVMDMRASYGGFATALVNLNVAWWVMNVVPISGPNTLPVIYDRGLIGVAHDWCEPFDTYPRTYDMLHAVGLFSQEQHRCNIAHIVLEMDRILRPGGWVLVREPADMAIRVQALAASVRWKTRILETESGPFGKDKLLSCQKLLWHN